MILNVHIPGAPSYEIGDEIWQEPLADAIRAEAEAVAEHADPLAWPDQAHRDELRDRIIAEMTTALTQIGDRYQDPDGVQYSLTHRRGLDPCLSHGRLAAMAPSEPAPSVEEVLRFEDLPLGSMGTRRAVVRWSDGTESEALTWYADETLSPVDHVGRQ